jgi:antitoxin component YwqK of YwqJK toxin-antitoxin module
MKKIILLFSILLSVVSFAKAIEPKLEIVGNLVKATYYYENGAVQQEGFFKDGKLDGKWTSYEANGNVMSIAEYTEGQKSGKWIYFTLAKQSKEVVYNNNEIVSVNKLNPIAKN